MWIFSPTSCSARSARPSTRAAAGLRHISLNRLRPAAHKATVPTTSGTILALKSHRNAMDVAEPTSAIMNIVNSCEGWKIGR